MADFLIPLALLNETTKFSLESGSGSRTHRRPERGATAAGGAITIVRELLFARVVWRYVLSGLT